MFGTQRLPPLEADTQFLFCDFGNPHALNAAGAAPLADGDLALGPTALQNIHTDPTDFVGLYQVVNGSKLVYKEPGGVAVTYPSNAALRTSGGGSTTHVHPFQSIGVSESWAVFTQPFHIIWCGGIDASVPVNSGQSLYLWQEEPATTAPRTDCFIRRFPAGYELRARYPSTLRSTRVANFRELIPAFVVVDVLYDGFNTRTNVNGRTVSLTPSVGGSTFLNAAGLRLNGASTHSSATNWTTQLFMVLNTDAYASGNAYTALTNWIRNREHLLLDNANWPLPQPTGGTWGL